MTLNEFYTELEKIAPQFTWRLTAMGAIRGDHKNGLGFCGCPLTCLKYAKDNIVKPSIAYKMVGRELKIDETVIDKIATGADNNLELVNIFGTTHQGYALWYEPEIRQNLLRITGLTDSEADEPTYFEFS